MFSATDVVKRPSNINPNFSSVFFPAVTTGTGQLERKNANLGTTTTTTTIPGGSSDISEFDFGNASRYSGRNDRDPRLDGARDRARTILEYGGASVVHMARSRILTNVYVQLSTHIRKARDAWVEFATLYSAAMGGNPAVEDLVLGYPADVYFPTPWEAREEERERRRSRYRGRFQDDEDEEYRSDGTRGPIDIEEEERESYGSSGRTRGKGKEPVGSTGERGDDSTKDVNSDDKKRASRFARELRKILAKYFRYRRGNDASLDAVLRSASRIFLDTLEKREKAMRVKLEKEGIELSEEERKRRDEEIKKGVKTAEDDVQRVLRGEEGEYDDDDDDDYENDDESNERIWEKRDNEFERNRKFNTFGEGDIVESPEEEDLIGSVRKVILSNLFLGRIKLATSDVNSIFGCPAGFMTETELCLTPILQGQFAKYMALKSVPSSARLPSKGSYERSTGGYYGRNGGEGVTIVNTPMSSRYSIAKDDANIKGFGIFLKRVRRNELGDIEIGPAEEEDTGARRRAVGRYLGERYSPYPSYERGGERISSNGSLSSYGGEERRSRFGWMGLEGEYGRYLSSISPSSNGESVPWYYENAIVPRKSAFGRNASRVENGAPFIPGPRSFSPSARMILDAVEASRRRYSSANNYNVII